ncbi:MAG: class I SAM-dependent methyltransferase [Patescibacteria group bacterium]|jgi:SAM-dependent methyltransferase|nr:class I SAM-dependent methyltransferase [Patescibacteria group bacterium]MDD5173012.1 class I SAM-dependent methyltransferase [Patescibacteria group bacterium]
MKKDIHFKNQAIKYSQYKAWTEDKVYLLKVFNLIKNLNKKYHFKKFLDAGCADGSFAKKLKDSFNLDAFGVDISSGAVKFAHEKGIKAMTCNLEDRLPFATAEFNLITACEVIEHIYDTDFFIEELKRILKNGGILIITTPNLVSLKNRIKILFGRYPRFVPEYSARGAGHIRAYTMSALTNQLKEHRFKIFKITSPNIIFPITNSRIPQFFKKIAIRLGDFFPSIGSHIIIVAQK